MEAADHQERIFSWIENHLLATGPSKNQIQNCVSKSVASLTLPEGPPDHNIICEGLDSSPGSQGVEEVIDED